MVTEENIQYSLDNITAHYWTYESLEGPAKSSAKLHAMIWLCLFVLLGSFTIRLHDRGVASFYRGAGATRLDGNHQFAVLNSLSPRLEAGLINEDDARPWQYILDCCLPETTVGWTQVNCILTRKKAIVPPPGYNPTYRFPRTYMLRKVTYSLRRHYNYRI